MINQDPNDMRKINACFLFAKILWFEFTLSRSILKNIDLVKNISRSQSVVLEGDNLELECRIDIGLPDRAELAWVKLAGLGEVTYLSTRRKEDGVTDYEEEFSSFLEQEDGELVWSLTITRVESSMAGFYQCEVLLDDEPVSSRKVLVNVDKRDDPNDDTSDPDNMTFVLAKMGTNVTLNCSDLGEEEDLVLWTKQNVGNIGKHNKTLPLIHVDKTHSGVYTCTVTGSSKLMHVSLLVSHEPHVSAAHYSVSQAIGLSIQLDCEVAAVPVPAVSWLFHNEATEEDTLVQSQGNKYITIQDYEDGKIISSLNIRNVSHHDYGQYTCRAENTEGKGQVEIFFEQYSSTSRKLICDFYILIVLFFITVYKYI